MSEHYQVVGQNNRNTLVQSKRLAPYHEDLTRKQPFEPSSVNPGQYTKIKLDFKHAHDREIILNDIRLRFQVDFSARANVGRVWCARGTDLIREMVVKVNEDIVFKCDKKGELTMLWLMNNHRTAGEPEQVHNAMMLNHGIIPSGHPPRFYRDDVTEQHYDKNDDTNDVLATSDATTWKDVELWSSAGEERWDGAPRLIYMDKAGTYNVNPPYMFQFDMSLNQLVGPIFHRLHLRRIEFVQIELMFEPWVSTEETQNFLLFSLPPTGPAMDGTLKHPYSVARITNLEIQQYRTTLLDGVNGFTLPDNRMLSWLMHRFSRREYTFNFDTQTSIDIQLHDWEIRTNIIRVWWMLAPPAGSNSDNRYYPFAEPCEGYDYLSGVEILWKNDSVLNLENTFDVYRHYVLSENKRFGFADPYVRFARLTPRRRNADDVEVDNQIEGYRWQGVGDKGISVGATIGKFRYEVPIYHVDLNMNIQHAVPGSEIIGGIVNDTSDYVIRIKRLSDRNSFLHTGSRTLWVWIEYQTLVNLAGGSNQYDRGSQVITKQLNPQ